MTARSKGHHLATWEVALVKAMLKYWDKNDQDILAYFTRPNRSVNHRLISQIRTGDIHSRINSASKDYLLEFVANYPQIDWDTGLHLYGDELLIKSREAMLNAVQTYNNPRARFRSEIFIVSAVIAWTYLLHAFYKSKNVDYRYKRNRQGRAQTVKTVQGADRYWDLVQCLNEARCPLDESTKKNLFFLLEIRNEIEHRMTNRIDDFISAKLQACCQNFNTYIKEFFGEELGFDNDLSFALQFSHLSLEQQREMAKAQDIPENIILAQDQFETNLNEEVLRDPRYAIRVILVPKKANRKGQADQVVEFISPDSKDAESINRVLITESEKEKYKPRQIVEKMKEEGFANFSMHDHTQLWRSLDAKNPEKNYGISLSDGQWYWYKNWLERVREHCRQCAEQFQT